jgi:hypothetical protein
MAFEGYFQMAGSRGLGVFVSTRDGSDPALILQYRATDPGARIPYTELPMSLVTDVHVQFCPWCGVRLHKWYRNVLRSLDRSELKVPAE